MSSNRGLRIRAALSALLLLFLFGGLAHSAAPNRIRRRIGGGGAVPFPNVSGLQARLIADTGTFTDSGLTTPTSADGATVLGWKDQSGNAFNFTATAGPVLKLGIVGGRPVLRFNGTSQVMSMAAAGLGIFQNAAGGTICGVFAAPATVSRKFVAYAAAASTGVTRFMMTRTTGSAFETGGRRLDADTFQSVSGGTFTPGAFTADFAMDRWASAVSEFWSNGVKVASSGAFQTAGNTTNAASFAITIGAQEAASFLAVDIAEIEFYNRDLTDAERQSLERYYKSRYGLSF